MRAGGNADYWCKYYIDDKYKTNPVISYCALLPHIAALGALTRYRGHSSNGIDSDTAASLRKTLSFICKLSV